MPDHQLLVPGQPLVCHVRSRLLAKFDELWFDCLNGDSREPGSSPPPASPTPVCSPLSTIAKASGRYSGGSEVRKSAGPPGSPGPVLLSGSSGALTSDRTSSRASMGKATTHMNWSSHGPCSATHFARRLPTPSTSTGPNPRPLCFTRASGAKPRTEASRSTPWTTWRWRTASVLTSTPASPSMIWRSYIPLLSATPHLSMRSRPALACWPRAPTTKPTSGACGSSPTTCVGLHRAQGQPLESGSPRVLGHCRSENQFLLVRCKAPKTPDGSIFLLTNHLSDQHALQTDAYFFPDLA